ncbi:retrovirus-related pol polyprotein from transposon TNT 1-94 [Tanacetum coccineum]|uniref:Retrovirus-related pol polyprotein from transposon TNT 1-94 n=1 Tax=Tanacetum coccineum TaxID=301880 RepID=A0ABQ5CMM5_9ASTR
MTKVTDLEANLEQFKIEQAAINSEAKQLALLQATIEKNKVEAHQQFAEIVNALKALQPPTTLPEDTTTMIDMEKSGEDCGNLDEFMVASDVEEAAITTPIMVVAEELGQKLIYDFGEADLMLASEGKYIQRVSCDSPAGNKSVEKENIKSGITCEENFYQPYRRVVEQSHNMFGWHAMRLKRRRGGDMLKQHLEDKMFLGAGQGTIFNANKEIVLRAPRRNDVYVLDMSSLTPNGACFFAKALESVNWVWHKRLSHLNFKNINKLAKQNKVLGLPSLVYSKGKPCSTCEKEKHKRASFKTKQNFSIMKCFHLLHMDLFGPSSPRSITHEKYTLIIVDEYSRYTWVHFLKKKSHAAEMIVSFIRMVETQNDVKVKQIRTDNETEFRNSELESFVMRKEFLRTSLLPIHLNKIGVAETKNRILIEAARTMLNGSEDDPSRKYQANSKFSYYIIPYGCSLTELTQEKHVPEVIAPNEQDNPQTKDVEGPTDLTNIEETQEQNVQNEQINHQLTEETLGNNTETSDRWSRDQYIELVNIIGDPSEGMLTRSMASKLTVASVSECLFADFLSKIEPKKVSKALKHPGWVDAMQEELNQFYKNKVWTLVPLPYENIGICSKWVFRFKKDEHGIVTKNKARLVAQGYSQEEGINYDETFAPAVRMEAIKIFFAFATYMNFIVFQMDVKSAFLNGKLKKEVYVKQPLAFQSSEFPEYVCKLDKALYGLKQAPRAWYETLSTFLIQNNFVRGRIDNTLFIYISKGEVLHVQVYMDDIIFGSTSYKLCKQFEKLMTNKFEMSMIGKLTYFIGLQIKQDHKGISICQEQYTRNLLKKYEIFDSFSVKTPMVPPSNLRSNLVDKPVNKTLYGGMIGSLMYLTATTPDIQFSICLCARYQASPNESHLTAVKRIFRYLKGTPSLGLWYPKCLGFDLKGYSDSDYASCNMDR